MAKRKRSMCVPETHYRCTYYDKAGECDYRESGFRANAESNCWYRCGMDCTNKAAQRAARRKGGACN